MEKGMNTASDNALIDDSDLFYFAYKMIVLAMKDKDIEEGLKKALYLAKLFINAEDIIIFKMDEESYKHYTNQNNMENNSCLITCIINQIYLNTEQEKRKKFQLLINSKDTTLIFEPVTTENNKYIIAITSLKGLNEKYLAEFLNVLNESMSIILSNIEQNQKLRTIGSIDGLSGLNNRTEFEKKQKELDQSGKKVTFALFDLFQLKYINDTYTHYMGDQYIKQSANLLRQFFKTTRKEETTTGKIETSNTGDYIYRIGGDEFVVISNEEENIIRLKAQLVSEEARHIDFGQGEDAIIGINYGVTTRLEGEAIKETYKRADEKLKASKAEMYNAYKIDRRKCLSKKYKKGV